MDTLITIWAWCSVAVGVLAGCAFFLAPIYFAVTAVLGALL